MAHPEPTALATDDIAGMHHWRALNALGAGDLYESAYNLKHVAEHVMNTERLQRLDTAIEPLKFGDRREAEHHVESVLAGMGDPELHMSEFIR